MKRKPFKVQIDSDVEQALQSLGADYQMTGNAVLASAAAELARVHKAGGNLWHALGRIAADDTPAAAKPVRIERTGAARALQTVG